MAADLRPFAAGASKVWTIAPGADFLGSLASVLSKEFDLANRPDALADAIIYVPNRRSARALTLALFDTLGGKGTLLPPDVRTLGDLESEEPPPVSETALMDIATPLSPASRLGVLAKLVSAFFRNEYRRVLPPASALAAARELSRLLEQATFADAPVNWSKLDAMSIETELAGHLETSTRFLAIVAEAWPEWLTENGVADPFAYRLQAADALAESWRTAPPTAPVIIAGSTGATPSGRTLMKAALGLPNGLVVFPGLDTYLSGKAIAAILKSPSHPQHALVKTVQALGLAPDAVMTWPEEAGGPERSARRKLVHEALAPADDTADWRETLAELAGSAGTSQSAFARAALEGLSVVELPNEAAEADAAALLLRDILRTPSAKGALITPDAGLARRVGALLKRWDIHVPPSAGQPLSRTPAGSLISLCTRWAADPADPVALSAVLKHPFVSFRDAGDLLDHHFLRGPRRWKDLPGLAALIDVKHKEERKPAYSPDDQVAAASVVRSLADLVKHLGADFSQVETVGVSDGVRRIAALAEAVSETPLPWAGEDGAGASKLLERLDEMGQFLDPVHPGDLADLVGTECANLTVSMGEPEHPRLSIWGPLEARLQSSDLVVLAGLNEDVWPEKTPPDAFLPRRFRAELGLMDPDERLGLSAHDFAQLACAPRVVMLHAARREDSPAVASRWVWRLRTLAQGALREDAADVLSGEAAVVSNWVRALHTEQAPLPAGLQVEPRPTRRPARWPYKLSVTRVDRLQRDPYAIWAEDVLRLRTLDPMNGAMQANLRGTAIHKALELFEKTGAEKSEANLLALLKAQLEASGAEETDWLSRAAIWENVASWYLYWRSGRDISGGLKLEVNGKLEYLIAGDKFTLSAQADRIETSATGQLTIVDFKTGASPSDKAISTGFDQQMPLQALIAQRGGFELVPGAPVTALEYVEFKGKPKARKIGSGRVPDMDVPSLVTRAEEGLQKLISAYRRPGVVFASAPRVQFVKYDFGFNLLARRAEWTSDTSDGEGGDE
ncbi:MAG TPA: double-strand break repair protein AddB [Hyphomonas sp.]|nr:double-strand break repair protein AddB [Hyphomonas sp.]HRJ01036.1 double-strand break repair protein AddB [Hyphomonas sp.]HRK66593.1 double-strand break repair protein AddB [Hyphomonas sp.]